VAFLSKSLNKTERSYKIHDKEILAMIRGLKLKGGYLVGNMSCVIHKRTWQETTTVFYQLFI